MKQFYQYIGAFIIITQITFAQEAYMHLAHSGITPSSTMTVEPGQEITFEYGGGGPHPMTSGQGSTTSPVHFPTVTVNSSNPIATFSLEEEGTYIFHCGTNPGNTSLWGTIIVEPAPIEGPMGDVDLNGMLNFTDITYMMFYFYGMQEFSDEQMYEADVSQDSTVSPLDLSLLKMAINTTIELPYPNIDGVLDGSATYALDVPTYSDGEITVPVSVSALSNVISIDLSVVFDNTSLTLDRVDFEESWDGATTINVENNGNLRLIVASPAINESDNLIANLVFTVNETSENNTSVTLVSSQTNESGLIAEESTVDVQLLGVDNIMNIPTQLNISGAFPNPFNPAITLLVAIADVRDIHLEIFNTKGQAVKTFSSENFVRGTNSITWNGLNNQGQQVPSGIYIVKASSSQNTTTKTITLLK
ncbi:MAG: T9SS type A sorting domain-containing protein [Candidatus Marinimicrobia bacterium]|nr:T9SS type A sorting domain-containing protein [Candidatus Neomarinimicrobiota bacterium]